MVLNGSPANHVTSLLFNRLVSQETHEASNKEVKAFLNQRDLLHILADLVMALPNVAAAIHRFKPASGSGVER